MTVSLRATARLQFHRGFTLEDACGLVDYFAALGISHLYASPITRAVPGSTHGYDVVDYNLFNPELGGEKVLHRLVERLRAHGMGLILDIVPNHMATHADNAWWWSVLQWGASSPYAGYFDIDWNFPNAGLRAKVLAPFLGASYGHELESGHLRLDYDASTTEFIVRYHEQRFPITPTTYGSILRAAPESTHLIALYRAFDALATSNDEPHRAAAIHLLQQAAALPEVRAGITAALAQHDPQHGQGRTRLHRLLEQQHYRLAWWRCAADAMNWRRFFEITGLIGTRMDREEVFAAAHGLVLRLYGEGLIDGVRIDHVDGLGDPQRYCLMLREALAAAGRTRPRELTQRPYIIVEKILAPDERLDARWAVDGTTGYEFMDEMGGLLHAVQGAEPLNELWQEVASDPADFGQVEYEARQLMVARHFAGEVENMACRLHQLGQANLITRDFTLPAIRRVLVELLANFPVYRTYVNIHGRSSEDAMYFAMAKESARQRLPSSDGALLDALDIWLGGEAPYRTPTGPALDLKLTAIRQFQQLTTALAAKSVEDTAFYRYGRLLSRNEVGSNPAHFSVVPNEFHADMQRRAASYPFSLLATATHDHKRGEDVRGRLAVISEVPEAWNELVGAWLLPSPQNTAEIRSALPHLVDQYTLLQTLVGAWPLDLRLDEPARLKEFADRVVRWQQKALREGKQRSGWFDPNQPYEALCEQFIRDSLHAGHGAVRLEKLVRFVERIAPAGAINSLTQTLVRLTAPGVPDLYQGTEFWDFSLTDPDNRNPVDYDARINALETTRDNELLLRTWRSGHIKQELLRRVLQFRRHHAALFARGDYAPVAVEGPCANHVVAFLRHHKGQWALTVAPRLPLTLMLSDGSLAPLTQPMLPPEVWRDTTLSLPPELSGVALHGVMSDGMHLFTSADGTLPLADVLATFPVALWHD